MTDIVLTSEVGQDDFSMREVCCNCHIRRLQLHSLISTHHVSIAIEELYDP